MFTISQLEAINRIMQPVDGSIVSDLTQPLNDNTIQAMNALTEAVEKIQYENQWNFNSDGPEVIVADNNGIIEIPSDYLYIEFMNWTQGSVWNLTVKDGNAWDRKNATNVLNGQVTVMGTRVFQYNDLPAIMQNLAIAKARYEFCGLATHLSAPRIELFAAQLKDAYMAAQKWDAVQQHSVIDVYPSIRDAFRFKGQRVGWWWGN